MLDEKTIFLFKPLKETAYSSSIYLLKKYVQFLNRLYSKTWLGTVCA